jgi:predicted transcriptional regulator
MSLNDNSLHRDIAALTSEIVSAYVSKNAVTRTDLTSLIASVHSALSGLGKSAAPEREKRVPPIPIKKTITPDFLISLEDGQQYRTLRRHLTRVGLTPEQYREKWGLPDSYPMVAPNYASLRSKLALEMGFGKKAAKARLSKAAKRK